ncbi:MAG TPA: alpha/beta hydrolase [Dehalococcoidia bacterium]|nr:alpha/beta hydrolase [Dehalococcoidia bacterium]
MKSNCRRSTWNSLRLAGLALGLALFSLEAGFLGVSATAASSLPVLAVLWLFTPAPAVFAWRCWPRAMKPTSWHRKFANAYLSAGAVVSVLVIVGVGWIGSERGIHPTLCDSGNESISDYPLLEQAAEPVSFPVPGLGQRAGWFIAGRRQSTVILLHGFGCRRQEMLVHALVLNQAGYSTLLFDFYGHGESDGETVTLGFYERQDALAAVAYLKTRDDVDPSNLGTLGISMGASVAIMAAAMTPDIKAVVADSPFQSAARGIEEGFTRVTGLPRFPFAPIVLRFVQWRLGISPDDIAPIEQVAAISPRALLLIHGVADTELFPGNSEALLAAAGEPKELVLLPDIVHGRGIKDLPDEYAELIVGFFDRYLD